MGLRQHRGERSTPQADHGNRTGSYVSRIREWFRRTKRPQPGQDVNSVGLYGKTTLESTVSHDSVVLTGGDANNSINGQSTVNSDNELNTAASPLSSQDINAQVTNIDPDIHQAVESSNPLGPKSSSAVDGEGTKSEDKPLTLWDRAYDSLKDDEPKLVESYEKLLSKELLATEVENGSSSSEQRLELDNSTNLIKPKTRKEQFTQIVTHSLERAKDTNKSRWRFLGKEINTQALYKRTAETVSTIREWVSSAVEVSTEASMVWAGVCLLLPFLTNHFVAVEEEEEGFQYVNLRMKFYASLEPLMERLVQNSAARDVTADTLDVYKTDITKLYRQILEFQFRGILRVYESAFQTYVSDVFNHQRWKGLLDKVKSHEDIVRGDFESLNSVMATEEWKKMNQQIEQTHHSLVDLCGIGREHLAISQQMSLHISGLRQDQERRALSDKEQRCLQLFRVANGDMDASYEWYKNRVKDHIEGTCQWVLNHEHFRSWLEDDTFAPLLVTADPGCGKSVFAKYLVNHHLPASDPDIPVCYFFFKDALQNKLWQVLSALLHQLLALKPFLISKHVFEPYNRNGQGLVTNTEVLWEIFTDAVQDPETGRVIFILDALDECAEDEFLDLVQRLNRALRGGQTLGESRFLFTSRPYPFMMLQFKPLEDQFPTIRIPGEDKSEEISREVDLVIKAEVASLAHERDLSPRLQGHLAECLLKTNNRTYLWVYLVLDFLRSEGFEHTTKGINSVTSSMPRSINQAYEKILSKSKNKTKARKALSIILAAHRPLNLEEMNTALSVDAGTELDSDGNLELECTESFKKNLRSWCGLFIAIYNGKVHFLHQTAREFLVTDAPLPPPTSGLWQQSFRMQEAHACLAESCVAFLSLLRSDQFRQSKQRPSKAVVEFDPDRAAERPEDFLPYSSENFDRHIVFSEPGDEDDIVARAALLCDPAFPGRDLWAQDLGSYPVAQADETRSKFTALMLAICLELGPLIRYLIKRSSANIDARDHKGYTALFFAILKMAPVSIVKLLLDAGADVNIRDTWRKFHRPPIDWALLGPRYEVVIALFDSGRVKYEGIRPSSRIELLLCAIPEHQAEFAGRGPEDLRALLASGHFDDCVNDERVRPHVALALLEVIEGRYGDQSLFSLMVERGVALDAATYNTMRDGTESLGHDPQLHVPREDIRPPLHMAARCGNEWAVKILLVTNRLDVHDVDCEGKTALWHALEQKNMEIIRLIQEVEACKSRLTKD